MYDGEIVLLLETTSNDGSAILDNFLIISNLANFLPPKFDVDGLRR